MKSASVSKTKSASKNSKDKIIAKIIKVVVIDGEKYKVANPFPFP